MSRSARYLGPLVAMAMALGGTASVAGGSDAGALPAAGPPAVLEGPAGGWSPELLAAVQRDLRLGPAAARVRLGREDAAARVETRLREDLGDRYGGAWVDPVDQRLDVAVTNAGAAVRVRAAGARPGSRRPEPAV